MLKARCWTRRKREFKGKQLKEHELPEVSELVVEDADTGEPILWIHIGHITGALMIDISNISQITGVSLTKGSSATNKDYHQSIRIVRTKKPRKLKRK